MRRCIRLVEDARFREINVLPTRSQGARARRVPRERNKSAGRTNRGRGARFTLPSSSCYAYLNIYLSGVAGARIHRAWRRDEFMHFARDNCTSAEVRSSFALPEEMRFFFDDERRHFIRYLCRLPFAVSAVRKPRRQVAEAS